MGAFNEWAKGSFLEDPKERRVVVVAQNILAGAAQLTRAHFLRIKGRPEPALERFSPRRGEDLTSLLS
jgi:hypothetical protein